MFRLIFRAGRCISVCTSRDITLNLFVDEYFQLLMSALIYGIILTNKETSKPIYYGRYTINNIMFVILHMIAVNSPEIKAKYDVDDGDSNQ